jgi:hypothetical protein
VVRLGTKSIGGATVAADGVAGFRVRHAALVRQREPEWRGGPTRAWSPVLDMLDDPALGTWLDGVAASGSIDRVRY